MDILKFRVGFPLHMRPRGLVHFRLVLTPFRVVLSRPNLLAEDITIDISNKTHTSTTEPVAYFTVSYLVLGISLGHWNTGC